MARAFEWDEAKARGNLAKHNISFDDAIAVFNDPDLAIIPTIRDEDREARLKAVRHIGARLFTDIYTGRNGVRGIISARRANSAEEKDYGDSSPHA